MKFFEKMLAIMAWSQVSILFIFSLWSIQGEYLFASIAFAIMFFLLIDDYRKYGVKRMYAVTPGEPLGRNYYRYRFVLLIISCLVNLSVYVNLYLNS